MQRKAAAHDRDSRDNLGTLLLAYYVGSIGFTLEKSPRRAKILATTLLRWRRRARDGRVPQTTTTPKAGCIADAAKEVTRKWRMLAKTAGPSCRSPAGSRGTGSRGCGWTPSPA